MILKTFESYQKDNKSQLEAIRDAENWLEKEGHYKDIDDYWHVGDTISLQRCIHDGKLVVIFAEIRGDVIADNCGLTSLEGLPKVIKGSLSLSGNNFTQFKNSPVEKVDRNLYLSKNNITSLEGLPKTVGRFFYLDNPKLKTLNHAPNMTDDTASSIREGTQIHEVEAMWYSYMAGKKFEDRSISLLKYLINRLNTGVINEEDFKKLLSELWWPEGFLSKNLVSSLKSLDKFKL